MQNVDDMEDTSIGIYENKKTNMLQSSDAELTEALAEDAKDIVTQLCKRLPRLNSYLTELSI